MPLKVLQLPSVIVEPLRTLSSIDTAEVRVSWEILGKAVCDRSRRRINGLEELKMRATPHTTALADYTNARKPDAPRHHGDVFLAETGLAALLAGLGA